MALRASRLAAAAASVLVAAVLSACAPDAGGADPDDTGRRTSSPSSSASGTASPGATPTPSATARADIPDDCLVIVGDDVLSQLDGIPLNAAAFAPTGPQSDGSLICVWRDPATDTTGLVTTLSRVPADARPIAEAAFAGQGFSCTTSDGALVCARTRGEVLEEHTLRDDLWLASVESPWHPEDYGPRLDGNVWD